MMIGMGKQNYSLSGLHHRAQQGTNTMKMILVIACHIVLLLRLVEGQARYPRIIHTKLKKKDYLMNWKMKRPSIKGCPKQRPPTSAKCNWSAKQTCDYDPQSCCPESPEPANLPTVSCTCMPKEGVMCEKVKSKCHECAKLPTISPAPTVSNYNSPENCPDLQNQGPCDFSPLVRCEYDFVRCCPDGGAPVNISRTSCRCDATSKVFKCSSAKISCDKRGVNRRRRVRGETSTG